MQGSDNSGKTVMVVEDEYLIAQMLCEAFERKHWEVIGPYPDIRSAAAALDNGKQADLAILDVNLKGEVVYPLLDRLVHTDTAVVLTTGYDRDTVPDRYSHLPRLIKPVSMGEIMECANKAMLEREKPARH